MMITIKMIMMTAMVMMIMVAPIEVTPVAIITVVNPLQWAKAPQPNDISNISTNMCDFNDDDDTNSSDTRRNSNSR